MLTFDISKLTTLERAAIEDKLLSARSAPEAEPPSLDQYLQMHADHLLNTHVKEYVTSQLPLLEEKARLFLNCTPDQQAKIDGILAAASLQATEDLPAKS
jgi:hypothetical protein